MNRQECKTVIIELLWIVYGKTWTWWGEKWKIKTQMKLLELKGVISEIKFHQMGLPTEWYCRRKVSELENMAKESIKNEAEKKT